ncbi:MAG TPA: SGNH/GDSL hydrolase family protein [Bacteroidales bacterium]|nr:SGNH/GDSL hydrolase family protein [Bacteroidales bacterium]
MKRRILLIALGLSVITVSFAQAPPAKQVSDVEKTQAIRIAQFEKTLSDWANLGRFREENSKMAIPAPGEKRVVFMGNSITEGWKYIDTAFFRRKQYVNRGISGQTTPQMLIRFRQDVINLKPSAVVILSGINDIAGNTGPSTLEMIEDNLSSMTEIAAANNIKVIMCSVLPAYDFPWRKGMEPADKVASLNKWIKDYAERKGFIYVDYYSPMADDRKGLKSAYTFDGVHPNLDGYKIMEPIIEKAIKDALK